MQLQTLNVRSSVTPWARAYGIGSFGQAWALVSKTVKHLSLARTVLELSNFSWSQRTRTRTRLN